MLGIKSAVASNLILIASSNAGSVTVLLAKEGKRTVCLQPVQERLQLAWLWLKCNFRLCCRSSEYSKPGSAAPAEAGRVAGTLCRDSMLPMTKSWGLRVLLCLVP